MNIGKKINVGLSKKNMSRKELAEAMGVQLSAVTKWVNNMNSPPSDKLVRIISMLDLVEEFFPGYRKIDPSEEEKDIEIKKELKLLKEQMLQNVKDLQELKAQRV